MSRVDELSSQRNWICEFLKKAEKEGKDVGDAPIVAALYEISDTLALIYDKMSEKESLNDKSKGDE